MPKNDEVKEVAPEDSPIVVRDESTKGQDAEANSDSKLERVEVGKYVFLLGEDPNTDKDLRKIIAYIKAENTHGQWVKQGICFLVMFVLVLLNIALPTKSKPSPIGM